MKLFKETDTKEARVRDIALPTLNLLSNEKTNFYENAFTCYVLGEVLYDLKVDPMAGVITRDVYRISYPAIHELFTRAGTFEFYMNVFRAIWGESVTVTFTVPSPGVLQINVEALAVAFDEFYARRIVDDAYIYDEVIDEEGDTIIFQGTQGIKTQRETDALMNELHPEGVYVETTLDIS